VLLAVWLASGDAERNRLFEVMLARVCLLPRYGRAASDFQQLLSFLLRRRADVARPGGDDEAAACNALLDTLRDVNRRVAQHANAALYRSLSMVLELDGYFLESEPCRVCSEPNAPFVLTPITELTAENKYTSSTHIVRLKRVSCLVCWCVVVDSRCTCSQRVEFSLVNVSLSQVRRTRFVKAINVYYSNKQVRHAVVCEASLCHARLCRSTTRSSWPARGRTGRWRVAYRSHPLLAGEMMSVPCGVQRSHLRLRCAVDLPSCRCQSQHSTCASSTSRRRRLARHANGSCVICVRVWSKRVCVIRARVRSARDAIDL
jgi:hypothetical protein